MEEVILPTEGCLGRDVYESMSRCCMLHEYESRINMTEPL